MREEFQQNGEDADSGEDSCEDNRAQWSELHAVQGEKAEERKSRHEEPLSGIQGKIGFDHAKLSQSKQNHWSYDGAQRPHRNVGHMSEFGRGWQRGSDSGMRNYVSYETGEEYSNGGYEKA